jgi:hypothetical protein
MLNIIGEVAVKEIQVVVQWRRITSGYLSGVEAIHEIECRDDTDVQKVNKIYSSRANGLHYDVIATQIIKRSVPDDYSIHFSID